MLIPFDKIIKKYRMNITGIIHCGGHTGEEDPDYLRHNISKRHYFEPAIEAYNTLVLNTPTANHYNVALGSREGVGQMYIETFNNGQSNSLLKPGTHLKSYPLITFDEIREVPIMTLDSFNITGCNFINLDTQGTELDILKGATNTLLGIDYVYTEVNTADVYEGCGRVDDIDNFLLEFERVETVMTGDFWGDAFYIRRTNSEIANVPIEFKPHHPWQYPADNDLIFEEWYGHQKHPHISGWTYLPIYWTSYYCKHKYGKDGYAMQRLQIFLNRLDKNKKYYTIVQYDDGILSNIIGLNIKVFAMSGIRIDYALPLICKPHTPLPKVEKDIYCSYIGANNHPIRSQLMQYSSIPNWYISDKKHSMDEFCSILNRSKYVLCPRGYGPTSFRIMEALQYGAIPVYISDRFIIPHNVFDYGLMTPNTEDLVRKLSDWDDTIWPTDSFEKYFTYEANRKIIYKVLLNDNNRTVQR
ncbi:MAG: FkbM family methyltransferase [Taibaiella sp.]|nr:FkbM family methyltransferase [Taibaiella sp.]